MVAVPMPALGQKATSAGDRTKSALPPRTDIAGREREVRFVPIRDSCTAANQHLYSITSSVRASSIGERSTPECLRSLEIDEQLKFVRKFDRQVTRLGTFEDIHDVGSRATKVISEIDAIAD